MNVRYALACRRRAIDSTNHLSILHVNDKLKRIGHLVLL